MKVKILIYTMALSALMLTGCTKNNAQAQNKASEAHTTTATSEQANTATDNAHNITATDNATSTTHGNTNANGKFQYGANNNLRLRLHSQPVPP